MPKVFRFFNYYRKCSKIKMKINENKRKNEWTSVLRLGDFIFHFKVIVIVFIDEALAWLRRFNKGAHCTSTSWGHLGNCMVRRLKVFGIKASLEFDVWIFSLIWGVVLADFSFKIWKLIRDRSRVIWVVDLRDGPGVALGYRNSHLQVSCQVMALFRHFLLYRDPFEVYRLYWEDFILISRGVGRSRSWCSEDSTNLFNMNVFKSSIVVCVEACFEQGGINRRETRPSVLLRLLSDLISDVGKPRDLLTIAHELHLLLIVNVLEIRLRLSGCFAETFFSRSLSVWLQSDWLLRVIFWTHTFGSGFITPLLLLARNVVPMGEAATQVETFCTFVEAFLQLLLAKWLAEGLKMRKLTHSMRVKLVYTDKCFFANCLLVVSEKESPELFPLEKVFSVVFRLGHC